MKFPNKYLRNLHPYKVASHKIWAVKPEDRSLILKLDWNESTIPPSPKVAERLRELLSGPDFFNLYPATCNDRLLTALSAYVGLPKENVQYFAGSDALHEYICKVFIGVGDPVMILGPSYDNFRLTCQANGADVCFFNYEDDFSFNPSLFEQEIIKKEPAVVYICNPNNPTGNIHTSEYIERLLKSFPDTLFLIDEAYFEFSGVSCKELVTQYENILISRTMSKAFGLANFRIGYLIASEDNIQFVNKIRNPKNMSTFAQEAACAALCDIEYMRKYVNDVHEGMRFFELEMKAFADKITVHPSFGNFLLLEFISLEDKSRLLNFLAGEEIFVRDTMQATSVMRCFRVTMGNKEQMARVVSVIKRYYDQP